MTRVNHHHTFQPLQSLEIASLAELVEVTVVGVGVSQGAEVLSGVERHVGVRIRLRAASRLLALFLSLALFEFELPIDGVWISDPMRVPQMDPQIVPSSISFIAKR